VTSVGNVGAVTTVVINTTTAYGTEPSTQNYTSSGTVIDGGCWASLAQGMLTTAFTAPQSTQICIKAGTYTTAGTSTVALTGSATAPIWWRGYNTTIGDLEPGNVNWAVGNNSSSGLSYPTINIGANNQLLSSGSALWSGMTFTASRNGQTVTMSTNSAQTFSRCRFIATGSGTSAQAASTAVMCSFLNCYFAAPATSTTSMVAQTTSVNYHDCYFAGAGGSTTTGIVVGAGSSLITNCTLNNLGSFGVTISTGVCNIIGCTFKNCGGDSIRITGAIANLSAILSNSFFNSGGYDINNTSGTNIQRLVLANNLSYNPTSGHLNGFGDWAELNPLVDSTQSYVSSTNLALVSGSAGANAGLPGQWENQTAGLGGFPDTGAWDRSSKGGGPVGQITGARSVGAY
jgi:hypothetical protein